MTFIKIRPVGPAKGAFTLVELLVVISIIGLLVSIRLPALAKARKAAVATQCLVNVRSVGQAQSLYCTDNRGWTPDYSMTLDTTSDTTFAQGWQQASKTFGNALYVQKFGGYTSKLLYYSYITGGLNRLSETMDTSRGTRMLACPFDKNAPEAGTIRLPLSYLPSSRGCTDFSSAYDGGFPSGAMGFVGSTAGMWNIFYGTANPPGYGIMSNVEKYKKPSNFFFFVESNVDQSRGVSLYKVSNGNYSSYSHNYLDQVFYRPITVTLGSGLFNHEGKGNVVFGDMHAGLLGQTQLCEPTTAVSGPTVPAIVQYGPGTATRDNWCMNRSAILLRPLLP